MVWAISQKMARLNFQEPMHTWNLCIFSQKTPPEQGLFQSQQPGTPSVLFFKAPLPLKPATIAIKIGHLAFQEGSFGFQVHINRLLDFTSQHPRLPQKKHETNPLS